jgi:hypothetical protein
MGRRSAFSFAAGDLWTNVTGPIAQFISVE